MGKSLIIKGADFSANAVGQAGSVISGTFFLNNHTINIIKGNASEGRVQLPNHDGGARMGIYGADYRLVNVPKGKKIKITGIKDLCLDYIVYSKDHYVPDFGYNGSSYYMQDGVRKEGTVTEKHPYYIKTFSDGGSYFSLTNGSQDSVTFENNTNGEWFCFASKNTSNSAIDVNSYNIKYFIMD